LVNPVEKIEMQNDYGKFTIEILQNGNEVKIVRSIEFLQKEIPVNNYKEIKEIIDLWNEEQFRKLIFKSTF